MKKELKQRVRSWYMAAFPSDDMGPDISKYVTFNQIRKALYYNQDIYDVLGVVDSVVRERVFDHLAGILNVSYSDVYNAWINSCDWI